MKFNLAALFVVTLFPSVATSATITIDTVPVGNPGNAADTRYIDSFHPNGAGAVAYSFNIGKTEITNTQYAAFLNAVAASDPYGLYSFFMGGDKESGILRNGSSGSYTYTLKSPAQLPDGSIYTYADKPVIDVNSGDAMRFANWLHNGQPMGAEDATTTEDGAYTLNGATTASALVAVTRNANARWWIPSEDEWYKAAYHKNDGVTGNYWDYPTRTNSIPNNNPPSSDTGNSANHTASQSPSSNVYQHELTDAGAYKLSVGPYGTFDQGGNVEEWTEKAYGSTSSGLRGGSWYWPVVKLKAQSSDAASATVENTHLGFRIATGAIPEPSTALLAASVVALLATRRRRRG